MILVPSILFDPTSVLYHIRPYAKHHSLIHGTTHWTRVHRFALILGQKLKLSENEKLSIALFSWCHDLVRLDDSGNTHHEHDSARYVVQIVNDLLKGVPEDVLQMAQLTIHHHSDSIIAEELLHTQNLHSPFPRELTLNVLDCCCDTDRLNLLRLNIMPDKTSMSTMFSKEVLPLSAKLNKQKDL